MPGSKHDTQLTAAETNRDYMAEHGATDSDWGAALSSQSREEHRERRETGPNPAVVL
jgi:hypothetical protein